MEYRVLGRFELVNEGTAHPITRPLARGALFTLVLYRNRSVPPERLIDLLWGTDGDDRLHSLRSCMWNIRQVVAPRRLVTDDVGYRLCIDSDQDEVDVDRFRSLHRRGRAALSSGEVMSAVRSLEAALAEWESDRLADQLPATPAMASLITGLLEERRDARNALVHAQLAAGRHRGLLPELRTLVVAEPDNEQMWAHLMLALHRCGLRAAALQAFTQARSALATHIGVEPGPELCALRHRIQGNDPTLNLPADAAPAADGAVARTPAPHQLPADLGDFTGRAGEAAELIALLSPPTGAAAPRVAEVTGPPGVGKSALAVRVAHAVAHDYPDGQIYLRLDGAAPVTRKPPEILAEVLHALGIPTSAIPATLTQRAALFRTKLASRRLLIVLDDAACPEQVEPLLPGTAGCAVIITSRVQLTGIATGRSLNLAPLGRQDALELLTRLVGRERVEADPQAAHTVIDVCGRFPLALRIAGERLATRPSWPIAYLAHRLTDEQTRLDELVAGNLAVRASITLSYQTLRAATQRAFRLLTLTRTGEFTAWAGDVILGEPAGELIEALVDHSLLVAAGIDPVGQPRYRFHDLVREHAVELCARDPEAETARERLMRAWLELSDRADAGIPRGLHAPPLTRPPLPIRTVAGSIAQGAAADPVSWFAAERRNLLAAIHSCCAIDGGYRTARELALRMAPYLNLCGHHEDAEHIWTAITHAAESADDLVAAARARLRVAIVVAADRGDPERAGPLADQCIATFERTDDRERLARAYGLRAYCARARGDLITAQADAEHGLALAQEAGEPHAEFLCLRVLGVTLTLLGHHDDGISRCEQGLELARRLDDTRYICVALHALAKTRLLAGEPETVISLCRQGLDLSSDDREPLRAYFRQQLGMAYQQLQRHGEAIETLTIAAAQFESHNDSYHQACCLRAMAESNHAAGRHRQAEQHLQESRDLFDDLGHVDMRI